MRFFLAGIMQGSHRGSAMHNQSYRAQIVELVAAQFPEAEIYDPLADHASSLDYDHGTGRDVFFFHNQLCGQVDVLLAFVPEASMGTAIEMWEAHRHGRVVITISPLEHNWAVKFLSHIVYHDLEQFQAALANGGVAEVVARGQRPGVR